MAIFGREDRNAEVVVDPPKPPEKTAAELIAESLSPIVNALNDIKTKQDSLETRLQPKPAPAEAPQRTSVFDDEDRAIAERMTPLALRQLNSDARYEKDQVFSEYREAGLGDFLKECTVEINKILDGTPLVGGDGQIMRGNPEYIRNTIDMVFGRKARAAGAKFGGKDRGFFVEGAVGGGDSGEGVTHSQTEGLTSGQVNAFKKWGISMEDGKKSVARLKFVS